MLISGRGNQIFMPVIVHEWHQFPWVHEWCAKSQLVMIQQFCFDPAIVTQPTGYGYGSMESAGSGMVEDTSHWPPQRRVATHLVVGEASPKIAIDSNLWAVHQEGGKYPSDWCFGRLWSVSCLLLKRASYSFPWYTLIGLFPCCCSMATTLVSTIVIDYFYD